MLFATTGSSMVGERFPIVSTESELRIKLSVFVFDPNSPDASTLFNNRDGDVAKLGALPPKFTQTVTYFDGAANNPDKWIKVYYSVE